MFPQELYEMILEETNSIKNTPIKHHVRDLQLRYKEGKASEQNSHKAYMKSIEHRMAYLLTRMPATYATVCSVFSEIRKRCTYEFKSILDLGCGPGTVMWAGAQTFLELEKITLVEQDSSLLKMAQRFGANSSYSALQQAVALAANLESNRKFSSHDLAVFSYSLGELSDKKNALLGAFQVSNVLAVIEPGTPRGFSVIREARDFLIKEGAKIIAPCPHALECPMKNQDWCHFSVRLERSKEHKNAKTGSLSYEDEKFSYIVVAKDPSILKEPYHSRILRHPGKHSGHVSFVLCTPEGLKERTVSKKAKEGYKIARKKEWGDTLE